MTNDTRGARLVRGLVKAVFIGCYAAFMWASIHHVATFYNNFEQNGTSDTLGSYLLAGAIDITALVTTIGVMFFRKSMPKKIQVLLWVFIVGLALYSFFINWEYASHYQSTDLILQPTGHTTPVYDQAGQLHYVPQMVANTSLLFVNPALASCFTIFALIYSVVGEFFGTTAPTAAELQARLSYLEETASVQEAIEQLEVRHKKPGLIQRAKASALELKEAVKEVRKPEESEQETPPQSVDDKLQKTLVFLEEKRAQSQEITDEALADYLGLLRPASARFWRIKALELLRVNPTYTPRTTDPLQAIKGEEEDSNEGVDNSGVKNGQEREHNEDSETDKNATNDAAKRYPNLASLLATGQRTVTKKQVMEATGHSPQMLANRLADGTLKTAPRNSQLITVNSLVKWLRDAPKPKGKTVEDDGMHGQIHPVRDASKTAGKTVEDAGVKPEENKPQMTEDIPVLVKTHEDMYTRDNVVSVTP